MVTFTSFDRVWFLTWTTYGTWLPSDSRGFVSPKFESKVTERRQNQPGTECDFGRPELHTLAKTLLAGEPIYLTQEQAIVVRRQFEETAAYRGWVIVAGAVMANHVHLLVGVRGDPEPSALLRDFESYSSRSLNQHFSRPNKGIWWTEQGSKRNVRDERQFRAIQHYVQNQVGALTIWCAEESAAPTPS